MALASPQMLGATGGTGDRDLGMLGCAGSALVWLREGRERLPGRPGTHPQATLGQGSLLQNRQKQGSFSSPCCNTYN